ncbi:hypothetical protein ACCO45_010156 [Purpureocillium lilacinum]|uniref:Uncharacterized protein n=1 Tax=Purpureocillium lilacinum TaxID=33203 RepID=A0ACC4DGZ7_PURLI
MLRIGGNLDASSAASNDDYCLGQFDLLLQLLHELHSSKLVGCVHSRRQALVDTRTCSDDEDVVGNVLAAILQVHSLLRHARHAISDPSQYTLRVVSYESPNPGKLEVRVRLYDHDPVGTIRGDCSSECTQHGVPRSLRPRSRYFESWAWTLLKTGGGFGVAPKQFLLNDEAPPEYKEHVARKLGVECSFGQHCDGAGAARICRPGGVNQILPPSRSRGQIQANLPPRQPSGPGQVATFRRNALPAPKWTRVPGAEAEGSNNLAFMGGLGRVV